MRTYASFEAPIPYRIECWEEGLRPWQSTEDASLVSIRSDRIRVAVMDGVTPLPWTRKSLGINGAQLAANLLRAAFKGEGDMASAVRAVNAKMWRPRLPTRRNPQACYVAAEIGPDGRLDLVRGCDCDAYLRDAAGIWRSLFPAAARPAATVAWEAYLEERPELLLWENDRARSAAESFVWDDPAAFTSHPVGRHKDPVIESVSIEPADWTELVMTTDGAGLNATRAADVEGYLDTLCVDGHEGTGRLSHGDLSIIRVRRTPLSR